MYVLLKRKLQRRVLRGHCFMLTCVCGLIIFRSKWAGIVSLVLQYRIIVCNTLVFRDTVRVCCDNACCAPIRLDNS